MIPDEFEAVFNLRRTIPFEDTTSANQRIEAAHARIEALVSRAQDGDRDALALLYQEYARAIHRYIHIRVGGDGAQSEDLTQEVFLKVVRKIDSYHYDGKPFASWLFRIAHNVLVDHYRASKRANVPLTDTMAGTEREDPVGIVEQLADISEIKRVIGELPAQQREVISLRFGAGLSVAETARAIGRTEGTVKKLQHVALSKLRKLIASGQ